jgi:hypothetical protein
MSDDNFISRWSRRKREADKDKSRPQQPEPTQASPEQQPASAGERSREVEPAFDPATLPPIESIVAGTDIRAFLQKGVPTALTKAALRRAWSTDPAIRDFIEIAENQWDFTNPSSIPGFGALQAGDDVRKLASQAMGQLSEASQPIGLVDGKRDENGPPEHPSPPAPAEAPSGRSDVPGGDGQKSASVASMQHPAAQQPPTERDQRPAPKRKGHGAAIPR